MTKRFVVAAALTAAVMTVVTGQSPALVDTSTFGPAVGASVPALSGVDQFGQSHTLASAMGPKGAMLVFFRSADW